MEKPSPGDGGSDSCKDPGEEADLFNIDGSSPKHQSSQANTTSTRRKSSSEKGLQTRRRSSASSSATAIGSDTAFVIPVVLSPSSSAEGALMFDPSDGDRDVEGGTTSISSTKEEKDGKTTILHAYEVADCKA